MPYELSDEDFRKGLWRAGRGKDFPPKAIRYPEEYSGGPNLNVVCTQTDLPAAEQRTLVKKWCQILPTLRDVEFLWFHSKTPQHIFDAACEMPCLEGLWIKWSGINTLDGLGRLSRLRYFRLGSSPQVTSITPLRNMSLLLWLELENIKRIADLHPLGGLANLQGLVIEGSIWSTQVVETLSPLSQLTGLRHLGLANLRARDKSLSPLYSLRCLEYFRVANWWNPGEVDEIHRLNSRLVNG